MADVSLAGEKRSGLVHINFDRANGFPWPHDKPDQLSWVGQVSLS